MTLDASGVAGHLSDTEEDRITADWQDVYDSVYQRLSIVGFEQIETEAAVPFPNIRPEDYVALEGEEYTTMMATVDYWFSRCRSVKGWLDAELICREAEYKDIIRESKAKIRESAKLIHARKTDRPSETEIKEKAERQAYPRRLQQRITTLQSELRVVDGVMEGLLAFKSGLSRGVTLRGQEIDLQGAMSRGAPRRFNR